MTNRRIPLFQPAVQNVDEIQLTTFAASLVDGYIDEAEFINRRPGHSEQYDPGVLSPVNAMYYWSERDEIYHIAGRYLFKDGVSLGQMAVDTATRRASFVATKISGVDNLFINWGTKIYYTDGTTITNLTDTEASITWDSLQIATLDTYLMSISSNGRLQFSNVLDPTSWDGDFATAEALPDGLQAIKVVGDIVYLFGDRSIERWYNDGVTPLVPYQGSHIPNGTYSPDTIQVVGSSLIFLDRNRKLSIIQEGGAKSISAPFDKTIQSFRNTVTDAFADIMNIGGKTFYILTFPSWDREDYDGSTQTGITFVYDYTLDRWYEWGEYYSATSDYGPYMATSYAYKATTGQHYIGSREDDGVVYEVRSTFYQDVLVGGTSSIRTKINSGYFDHGTLQKKQVNRFMCRLKKGKVTGFEGGVVVTFRYRDENSADYGNTITIDMSDVEDIEFFVKEGPFGQYRARQYEVVSSSNKPFIMGAVEEDITLLEQ